MMFLEFHKITTMQIVFSVVGVALCAISYAVRLAHHISVYRGKSHASQISISTMLLMFAGYFGWGYWCSADPIKINIPRSTATPIGIVLSVIGLGLFIYSDFAKRGVGERDHLVSSGIYAKIRHPIYLSLILLHIGYPLIFRSFTALLSTLVWAAFIVVWTSFEEKNLEKKFGEKYVAYKKSTWF